LGLMSGMDHFNVSNLADLADGGSNDGNNFISPSLNSKLCHLERIWLDHGTARWLASILPNVTTLEVVQSRISSSVIKQIIYLLQQWSPKLISLKVWGSFQEDLSF